MENLINLLIWVVGKYPGNTGRFYAKILRENGHSEVIKPDVNHCLYGNPTKFCATYDSIGRPSWRLCTSQNYSEDTTPFISDAPALVVKGDKFNWESEVRFKLLNWQIRALNKWQDASFRGVVSAITGSGKTKLAIATIEVHINLGWQVLVVVNKKVLQEQWIEDLVEVFGESFRYKIGRLGNGYSANFTDYNIIVAIVNTAAKLPVDLSIGKKGLIIADECHHYEAPGWFQALKPHFTRRLGLTATYDPDEPGDSNENLDSFFNGVVYELDFAEAIDDNIISHFNVEFLGCFLSKDELAKYNEAQEKMNECYRKLVKSYDKNKDGEFFSYVSRLSKHGTYPLNFQASAYLSGYRGRRDAIIESKSRYNALTACITDIEESEKTFVFTETISVANRLADILDEYYIDAVTIDSTLSNEERNYLLNRFGTEEDCKVLIAPRLLDEGINIPSADLAIIFASTKSKRQMIQRVGRVLRKVPGKIAKIIILYGLDTYEDPREGAHEKFIDLITEAADDIDFYVSIKND